MDKNLIVTFLLFLFFIVFVNAQDVRFGVRLGPNFTTFGGEDSEGSNFGVGYHFGGYANIPLEGKISFEPGLQIATKGAGSEEFVGVSSSVKIRNTYLDIPLLMKFDSNDSFFFFFGAQPSFLLGSAMVIKGPDGKVTVDGAEIKDLWKGFDFAGIVGFGFHLGQGINIQTSYEHGFANTSEISDNIFNRGFKLSLGKTF